MRRLVFGLTAVLTVLVGAGADAFGGVRAHRDRPAAVAAGSTDRASDGDDSTIGEGGLGEGSVDGDAGADEAPASGPVVEGAPWSPAPDAPLTAGLIATSPPGTPTWSPPA